jgi:hypothetical protein
MHFGASGKIAPEVIGIAPVKFRKAVEHIAAVVIGGA